MCVRLALPLLLLSAGAQAQTVQLCAGGDTTIATDGRVLGHFPYGEAPEAELVDAPAGLAEGRGCKVRADIFPDLQRLVDAVRADPAAGGRVTALSCFRPIARQGGVFCGQIARDLQDGVTAADRAISVAPPGHSEHATGYAIDFGVRPSPNCPDLEACMAATPVARWLRANAGRYGFELSFPPANGQNVKWEPWHWRWVGTGATAPGAAKARFLFARARRAFPANPAVFTLPVPAPPIGLVIPAPPPAPEKTKRRRRR